MNKCVMLSVAALCMASVSFAGDAPDAIKPSATNSADKTFTALPLCRRIDGNASVRKPGGEWVAAEEGKFYPFGTSYRAEAGGSMVVSFGTGSKVTISDGSEFGTRSQKVGLDTRTIILVKGIVDLDLASNLPEGAFTATAPGFIVKNMAGASRITYEGKGDGDLAVVRCVTGSLGIEGKHYNIPAMHAADEVKIRTSKDGLCTFLYGTSGDYVAQVDQGLRNREEFADDGTLKTTVEQGRLDWRLAPSTKIIINRSVPAIGERMSVHAMAFDASGERKSECYFCEGRPEVNSGELVSSDAVSSEELAKRAAEVTETAATDTEDAPATDADSGASDEEE